MVVPQVFYQEDHGVGAPVDPDLEFAGAHRGPGPPQTHPQHQQYIYQPVMGDLGGAMAATGVLPSHQLHPRDATAHPTSAMTTMHQRMGGEGIMPPPPPPLMMGSAAQLPPSANPLTFQQALSDRGPFAPPSALPGRTASVPAQHYPPVQYQYQYQQQVQQQQQSLAAMMMSPVMMSNPSTMMRGFPMQQQQLQHQPLPFDTGAGAGFYSHPGLLLSPENPLQGQGQMQMQQHRAHVDLADSIGAGGTMGAYPVGATVSLRQPQAEVPLPPSQPPRQQQAPALPTQSGEPHTEPDMLPQLDPSETGPGQDAAGPPAMAAATASESAGGPVRTSSILSSAVPTDPQGYSFLSEIQELYSGGHLNNPKGMNAASTSSLTAKGTATPSTGKATGELLSATTGTGREDLIMVGGEAASGQGATAATATTMISPSADSAHGLDFAGTRQGMGRHAPVITTAAAAVEAGGTGVGEGGAGVGYIDGNSGAPLPYDKQLELMSSRPTTGIVAGVRTLPSTDPHSVGNPYLVGVTQDAYSVTMRQQPHQQQLSAPFLPQRQLGYPVAQQRHGMLSQVNFMQQHVSHLKRRSSSDSISSDDDHSDAGEVPPHRSVASQQQLSSHPTAMIQRLEGGAGMSLLYAEGTATSQQQQLLLRPPHSLPHPQLTRGLPLGISATVMGLSPQQQLHQQLLLQQQQQQLYRYQNIVYGDMGRTDGYGGGIPIHLQHHLYPSSSSSASFPMIGGIGGGGGYDQTVPRNEAPAVSANNDVCEGQISRKEKRRRTKSFPEKLMNSMMEHAVDENAVAWLPDGKSFVVVNSELFVQQILRPAFKECKYSSFVRKLHRWGFVRMTSGTGTDCFHHPLFQNHRIDLVSRLSCAPREKDGTIRGVGRGWKPPSLAGVERFVRAKAEAVNAAADSERDTELASSLVLEPKDFGSTGAGHPCSEAGAPSLVPSTIEEEEEDEGDETDTIASSRAIN